MNKIDRSGQHSLDCGLAGLCALFCSILAACAAGTSAIAATAATATTPPRLAIDLNAFDASKKLIALPNGQSLAYIDRGERSVPAFAYGPGLLAVSHGPQEFVKMGRMAECAKIYALTAARMLL